MPTVTARKQQDGPLPKTEVNQPAEQPQFSVAPFLGEKQRALLRKGMCAKLSDDQAEYFFEVVERTELDPFEGQIWPSVRMSKDEHGEKHPTMFVLVKLQGFRAIGDRSNLCDGEDPVEWCFDDGIWLPQWLSKDPPVAARARVYRKDRSRPQTVVCRWDAYCQFVFDKSGREVPNAIWKRLGSHMLGKCALAGCYRGIFPRQASNVYLIEEIPDEIDSESEAAIEAEMTRRYARDAEYWEQEKAKGRFPVGMEPKPTTEPEPAPEPAEQQPEPEPEPAVATAPEDPRQDWRSFPITRIRLFEGKTVGSLTENEMRGLIPWLEKVGQRWGAADNDIRAHFSAISSRMQHEREGKRLSMEEELDAELNYALQPKQR
jgi:hypothetical protein